MELITCCSILQNNIEAFEKPQNIHICGENFFARRRSLMNDLMSIFLAKWAFLILIFVYIFSQHYRFS